MRHVYGRHVFVASVGSVAVVTLDNPPHNYINAALLRDLADALEAVDLDSTFRAVVLRAEGKSFCAGADFGQSGELLQSETDVIGPVYEQAVRLFASEKPIVAAVQGAAVGAGLGLVMVADFRVASPPARFVANFVKIGFHPGFGLTHTLPRAIGHQRAAMMLLTGKRVTGEEAAVWGLVDKLVAPESLNETALSMAREVAENAPLAVVATRRSIRADLAALVRTCTQLEAEQQRTLSKTKDFAEGVVAVSERRPGNFRGH